MLRLQGMALSAAAARWLETTTAARVLSVFDRACNLINQDEAVLALVTSARGMTPFALRVDGPDRPFENVTTHSPVHVARAEGRLDLGPLQVAFGAAERWEARPPWEAIGRLYSGPAEPAARLRQLADGVALEGSLLDLFRPKTAASPLDRSIQDRARAGATRLVGGLGAHDEVEAVAGVRALAGLGGGLTPAGDDFILGAMLAAWAGLYGAGAARLGPALVAAAAPRTTTLSAAYLKAAAAGECTAHWHALFAAQVRQDDGAVQAAVASLVSLGHTSGADALAGFLAIHYLAQTRASASRRSG
jgi:hypothetical protein